jgi:protein TonB
LGREEGFTDHADARLAQSAGGGTTWPWRGTIAASLLAHAVTLLAISVLIERTGLTPAPREAAIAVVFAPATLPGDATPAVPAAPTNTDATPPPAPAAAEPPPVPAPAEPPPAAAVVELPPVPAPAEPPPASAAAEPPPVPMPTGPPPVAEHSPLQHVAPPAEEGAAGPHQRAATEHDAPRHVAALRAPPQPTGSGGPRSAVTGTTEATAVLPARPVAGMESDRPPNYPETARRRGEQGRVLLEVSVSADGMPVSVTVARSSGYPSLDSAALSAVQRWRFVPATRGGAPVAAVAEVPVRFRLTD